MSRPHTSSAPPRSALTALLLAALLGAPACGDGDPPPAGPFGADCTMTTRTERTQVVTRWYYDGEERLIARHVDRNMDGTFEELRRFTYDEQGRSTGETREDEEGLLTQRVVITYDDVNRLRTTSTGSTAEAFEQILIETLDADGNVMRAEQDMDADGTAERIITYTRATNGAVLTERRDMDNNGADDLITTNTLDDAGCIVREEIDEVSTDAPIDRVRTWTRGAECRTLLEERDHDVDGAVDEVIEHTYTPGGKPTRRAVRLVGLDGPPTQEETWAYDDQERVTRHVVSAQGNVHFTEEFTYHANGNLATHTMMSNASVSVTTHDEQGRPVSYTLDNNSDGEIDSSHTLQHDLTCSM